MINIVDVMPMEKDTLKFNDNIGGDWFSHFHILYHMMCGVDRGLSYENQPKIFIHLTKIYLNLFK